MAKPGMSRDEHTALGEELAAMRDRLVKISVKLSRAYPQTVAKLADRATTDLDRLRSKLDDIVFREYPTLSTKGNAGVYYPQRKQR
jgi:hypothetical protein